MWCTLKKQILPKKIKLICRIKNTFYENVKFIALFLKFFDYILASFHKIFFLISIFSTKKATWNFLLNFFNF